MRTRVWICPPGPVCPQSQSCDRLPIHHHLADRPTLSETDASSSMRLRRKCNLEKRWRRGEVHAGIPILRALLCEPGAVRRLASVTSTIAACRLVSEVSGGSDSSSMKPSLRSFLPSRRRNPRRWRTAPAFVDLRRRRACLRPRRRKRERRLAGPSSKSVCGSAHVREPKSIGKDPWKGSVYLDRRQASPHLVSC